MRKRRGFRRWAGLAGMSLAFLMAVSASPAAAAQPWRGDFAGFPGETWKREWGALGKGSFGFDRMHAQGGELDVFYGKGSSAPSCKDCPSEGGGQFYTDFRSMGRDDLADARTLHLRYEVRFPADWDFGRKGGKLPGLYGGPPGHSSGGNHGDAWSTRYMWRIRSDQPKASVYVYDPSQGGGYGEDVGLGAWNWQADGGWHSVEQSVDRQSGTITVWYDGNQVLRVNGIDQISDIPFAGVFFSTFFGGHTTEWGPRRDVHAQFRNFQVSQTRS